MGQRKRELKAEIQELKRINFQLVNENEFLQDDIKIHKAVHRRVTENDKGRMVVCQQDIDTIEDLQQYLINQPFVHDEGEILERSKVLVRKMYDIVDSKNK
jgi:hypothetical protein